jgi:hypothetical protein
MNHFPFRKVNLFCQVRWCTPVIPALERLRQEDPKFLTSPGYTGRHCLEKNNLVLF